MGVAQSTASIAAAQFPVPVVDVAARPEQPLQTAVFAGGCFWGIEAVFENLKGVTEAVSGYSGGSAETATYERTNEGDTGHAEAVWVTYDPSQITYGQLLRIYFSVAHDPTQLNRQGADIGTQYRSAIFYANEEQRSAAQSYIQQLTEAQVFDRPIVTQLEPLVAFYEAEDYHQDYIVHNPANPYVVVHDLPKLAHLRQEFPELYRN
ncbi:MAG: peptide-methionine (S)-S-oxide reductase MsrA [Cyanobacteria bacterium J069]